MDTAELVEINRKHTARCGPAVSPELVSDLAQRLMNAEETRKPIAPLVGEVAAGDVNTAYAIQRAMTECGLAAGRRSVGRKIGLTSTAVQMQLGVDQPDYGTLFSDMEVIDGTICKMDAFIQPRIEAEIALVLGRDLNQSVPGMADLLRAVDFVVPALEIVDSRIADWKITIVDTIADNGSSSRFVLGVEARALTNVDLLTCGMVLTRGGKPVSIGSGAACLGHPLKSALWLARTMVSQGTPLLAGDVVLTGALGPMVNVNTGDRFEARIGGFGPVCIEFG